MVTYYECSIIRADCQARKLEFVTGSFGDFFERIDSQFAVGFEKTGEQVFEAVATKNCFCAFGRVKVNFADKFAADKFFLGHALEDGHNGGISILFLEFGQNFLGFEGIFGGPKNIHDFLLKTAKEMTFGGVTVTFHILRL